MRVIFLLVCQSTWMPCLLVSTNSPIIIPRISINTIACMAIGTSSLSSKAIKPFIFSMYNFHACVVFHVVGVGSRAIHLNAIFLLRFHCSNSDLWSWREPGHVLFHFFSCMFRACLHYLHHHHHHHAYTLNHSCMNLLGKCLIIQYKYKNKGTTLWQISEKILDTVSMYPELPGKRNLYWVDYCDK